MQLFAANSAGRIFLPFQRSGRECRAAQLSKATVLWIGSLLLLYTKSEVVFNMSLLTVDRFEDGWFGV